MTTTATQPLSVELPVCPECLRVGKMPLGVYGGKTICTGPAGEPHRRVHMQTRTFEEKVSSDG